MASTPPQQTPTDDTPGPTDDGLDPQDIAGKMSQIDELLGLAPNADDEGAPETDTPKPDGDDEITLSEALAEGESPNDGGESRKTVTPPKTLQELAERTGIAVTDLYAIEIPAAAEGGESYTFGSLKDLAAQESDFAGRELEFEERRIKFGNEQAEARAELEVVLNALPKDAIKPEVLAAAKREREIMLEREAVRTRSVIPEWNNAETKATELAAIGEHLAKYGFDKGHIKQIADHRMLRYMRDNWTRLTLVENALAKVSKNKPVPKGGKRQPPKAKPKIQATPDSSRDEQLAAIDKLIAEG